MERKREDEDRREQQRANGGLEAALVDANSALHATRAELDRAAQQSAAAAMREAEALARITSLEEQLRAAQQSNQSPTSSVVSDDRGNTPHQRGRSDNRRAEIQPSSSPPSTLSSSAGVAKQHSPRQAVHHAVRQAALRRGHSRSEATGSPEGGGSSSSALNNGGEGDLSRQQLQKAPSSRRWGAEAFNNHEPVPLANTTNSVAAARAPVPPSYSSAQQKTPPPAISTAASTAGYRPPGNYSRVRSTSPSKRALSDSGWIKKQVAESPAGSQLESAVAAVAMAQQAQDHHASPRASVAANNFDRESPRFTSPRFEAADKQGNSTTPNSGRPITPENTVGETKKPATGEKRLSLLDFMSKVPADKVRRTGTTPDNKK